MNKMLLTISAVLFCAANLVDAQTTVATPVFYPTSCPTQQVGDVQDYFYLPIDLAAYLGMTTAQVDGYSKAVYPVNYDWTEATATVANCDDIMATIKDDTTMSPTAIGNAVGMLVQSQTTIARAAISEAATLNTALLAVLTATQKLVVFNAVTTATSYQTQAILEESYNAFSAGFFLNPYSVTAFDPNGGAGYPTITTQAVPSNAFATRFVAAVANAHAESTRAKALAARKARSAKGSN